MKNTILQWLLGGAGALVLSAAARAFEPPEPTSSRAYRWFYKFVQACLANFDMAKK